MSTKLDNIFKKVKRNEIKEIKEDLDDFKNHPELYENLNEDEQFELYSKRIKESYQETNIKIIKNYFSYPALLIHEFLHIIFSLLLFVKIKTFYITSPKHKGFSARLEIKNDISFFKTVIISIAPILSIIIFLILSINNNWYLIGLFYLLLNIKISLPSKLDILRIFIYKYEKKLTDKEYNIFINECFKLKIKDIIFN